MIVIKNLFPLTHAMQNVSWRDEPPISKCHPPYDSPNMDRSNKYIDVSIQKGSWKSKAFTIKKSMYIA